MKTKYKKISEKDKLWVNRKKMNLKLAVRIIKNPNILHNNINNNSDYFEKINIANKIIKNEFSKNITNKNFKNSQNYIINKKLINKELLFTNYSLDDKEHKYIMKIVFRIIISLIIIMFLAFLTSVINFSLLTLIIIFIIFLIFLYLFYQIFLYYKRYFDFYGRRKRLYTVIKYHPILDRKKIMRKI